MTRKDKRKDRVEISGEQVRETDILASASFNPRQYLELNANEA